MSPTARDAARSGQWAELVVGRRLTMSEAFASLAPGMSGPTAVRELTLVEHEACCYTVGIRRSAAFRLLEQDADDLCGALDFGVDREQRVVVDEPLGDADDGVGERVGVDPGVEGVGLFLFAVERGELPDGA